ncbi:MAG: LysM peptidoglycan-binding domain-containing protein [Deltaproteobacteria bacterium]|nr:MAG: LysM peptidoglycan-binding domain-containing protein [Deltaproteobacteria bacterium]
MISREGKVKLMDFGIARVRSSGEELTLPGVTLGTPAYMSKEQLDGMMVDWRTDIFSFGIVLYEMLTGERPFKSDEKVRVEQKIRKGDYIPPRKLNRKIPRPLQRLIIRCLEKKPGKRYRGTSDVRHHLERLAEKRNIKAEYQERLKNYLIKCGIFKGVVVEKTAVKKAKPAAVKKAKQVVKPRINWPRGFWVTKIALLVLLPAIIFSHFQNPGTLIHRLKKGETLSALAQHYYGDYQKSVYLTNRNRILNPARLRPGRDIVIPLVTIHQVEIGDSLPRLARSYLGDDGKSKFIAQFNATDEHSPMKVGDRLRIPFELQHRVKPGQTLASISKRYYGNTIGYRLLMSYNSIGDVQSLKVGDTVKLPITDSRIVRIGWIQRALDVFKGSPKEGKYTEDLREAIELYDNEDYPGSAAKLSSCLEAVEPGIENLVQIRKYLAFAHARMGEKELAAEQFIALLELQPDFRPDQAETTTEILEVFNNLELKDEEEESPHRRQ